MPVLPGEDPDGYRLTFEKGTVASAEKEAGDGSVRFILTPLVQGKDNFTLYSPEGPVRMDTVYVHSFGAITVNTFLGQCRGAAAVPAAVLIFLGAGLYLRIRRFRAGMRRNLCDYGNVRDLSLIIFVASAMVWQIFMLTASSGIDGAIQAVFDTANMLALVVLPAAFVLSILVTLSSITLMRREGRTWRNMLACILGVLMCLGTFLPEILYRMLYSSSVIDIHNLNTPGPYVFQTVESSIQFAVSYLETILISTIILSVKAARRIPSFDKDYILVLGCQVGRDGKATPLLRGRADAALEFARLQREGTGKDIIYVPSGGKGADEPVSEAEAIRDYLLSGGVPEDRILMEDRSATTYENFRNSLQLIRESGAADPKVAYATTGYHVFRSGVIANRQGIYAEGIGGRTKRYFWVNAFVREFIATVFSERRTHFKVFGVIAVLIVLMVGVQVLNNFL